MKTIGYRASGKLALLMVGLGASTASAQQPGPPAATEAQPAEPSATPQPAAPTAPVAPRTTQPTAPATTPASPAAAPPPTAAPSPIPPPPAPGETQSRWYGWQNLLAAAPFIVVLGLSRVPEEDNAFPLVGYPGVLFASPIVHWAHGNVAKGFGGMALQATSLVVFSALIPKSCNKDSEAPPSSDMCHLDAKAIVPPGAIVGAIVGTLIDATLLAHETVETPKKTSVMPMLQANQRGATLGLGGTF